MMHFNFCPYCHPFTTYLFGYHRASIELMSPQSDERNIHEAFYTFREKYLEEVLDTIRKAVLAGDAQKVIMSLAMLLALTVCPAMLGTQEAIRQSQSKNKREEHRARRCNLVVSCCKSSIRSRDINGKLVVLKDKKVRSQ